MVMLLAGVLPILLAAGGADDAVGFNRDIRPILADRCFACHGPDSGHRQAELRLDGEAAAKERVIVPGNPQASEFIARIRSADPDLVMPPPHLDKPLSAAEKDLLTRWVAAGAAYEPHWAYVPPVRRPPPTVRAAAWTESAIDRWIKQRLEQEGLSPAAEADPTTLLRRVTFDLTGLPPTLEELDAFLADHARSSDFAAHATGEQQNTRPPDAAYRRVVDRLLQSPAFGERLATYWLDLVRYADTVGYHGDQEHAISPYRDYVIDAFNDNLPFDQFTREQLAGDLLPGATVSQQIATGYNRMLQTSHEGGVQPKEYLAIYAADRVRNVSVVWMGATLGCAQCHDHKFDPLTMRDFYAMAAFFADIDEAKHLHGGGGDTTPTRRPPELELPTPEQAERLAELQAQLAELPPPPAKGKAEDKPIADRRAALQKELAAVRQQIRKCMVTVAIAPRPIRILPRGNWLDDSGPLVEPDVPAFLGSLAQSGRRANRLDLANWLTDPKGAGGLTARVFANRLWSLFFGTGLSQSLEDFGGQGEPPVHPELLDHLALEFLESGWDVKRLVRQIVTSRAYRQSSAASPELRQRDPANRLYARQANYRLEAEMVRDNALMISGLLVRQVGGDSVRPYQPDGYYRHLNFPTRTYTAHADGRQWRRGVYMHWQRTYLHPMLKALDAPSREECTGQRPRSNTPLASLVLLNDPSFVEAARLLGQRMLAAAPAAADGASDDKRLAFGFRLATSRLPDATELATLRAVLTAQRAAYQAEPDAAAKLVRVGLAPPPTGDPIEAAAWTAVARVLLNLDETITRN